MITVSGGIFVVNIFKHQHIPELFFRPFGEAAALGELRRVFIGAEQTIPKGDIREIVLVHVPFIRLRLLSTLPHGNAASFGYAVMASCDTDFHRADDAPSQAHAQYATLLRPKRASG